MYINFDLGKSFEALNINRVSINILNEQKYFPTLLRVDEEELDHLQAEPLLGHV